MAGTTLNLSVVEKRIFNPSPSPRNQRLGPRQSVKPPPVGQWVAWGVSNRWRDADVEPYRISR